MYTSNAIQQMLGGTFSLMLAKIMTNDMPHAVGLIDNNYERPATPAQLRHIAVLCMQLGIDTPYEGRVKTFGEAGRMIRELESERKYRK